MNNQTISKLNDLFRKTMITTKDCRVVMTEGVAESPVREQVISAVRMFNNFNENNDPHGEHDFGKVIVEGETYFFKIDYYDADYQYGADPYEGPVCRLLTIMRSDEY